MAWWGGVACLRCHYANNYHYKKFNEGTRDRVTHVHHYWVSEFTQQVIALLTGGTYSLASLSEKTRETYHLLVPMQRQPYLTSIVLRPCVPVGPTKTRILSSHPGRQVEWPDWFNNFIVIVMDSYAWCVLDKIVQNKVITFSDIFGHLKSEQYRHIAQRSTQGDDKLLLFISRYKFLWWWFNCSLFLSVTFNIQYSSL